MLLLSLRLISRIAGTLGYELGVTWGCVGLVD